MANELFEDRRKGLEEEFFAHRNRKLREELRERQEKEERRRLLAEASGIESPEVLEKLLDLDMTPETVAALTLAPLVVVAWADGSVDAKERAAVLEAADQRGLREGTPGYGLLSEWLSDRPPPTLFEVWKEYARALASNLDGKTREDLRGEIVDNARTVAEAAGGVLGIKKVSAAEQEKLRAIEEAFRA